METWRYWCSFGAFLLGIGGLAFFISARAFTWPGITGWTAFVTGSAIIVANRSSRDTEKRANIARAANSWWPFKSFRRRENYFYQGDLQDNAEASSTYVILGYKSGRSFGDWLRGRDGWAPAQRKAVLGHERGHMYARPFFDVLFAAAAVLAAGAATWGWEVVLLPLMFFAVITLHAWLDELVADTVAGPYGLTLVRWMAEVEGLRAWLLGGFGGLSHPPLLLRILAWCYALPTLALGGLLWWGYTRFGPLL